MAGIFMLQANLQHSKAASGVLQRILYEGKVNVALIQEPWAFQGRIRGLSTTFGKVFHCTNVDRPRTCVFVKGLLLPQFTSRD